MTEQLTFKPTRTDILKHVADFCVAQYHQERKSQQELLESLNEEYEDLFKQLDEKRRLKAAKYFQSTIDTHNNILKEMRKAGVKGLGQVKPLSTDDIDIKPMLNNGDLIVAHLGTFFCKLVDVKEKKLRDKIEETRKQIHSIKKEIQDSKTNACYYDKQGRYITREYAKNQIAKHLTSQLLLNEKCQELLKQLAAEVDKMELNNETQNLLCITLAHECPTCGI